MSTESRTLNDGRTAVVRHGAAGEVEPGDVLVTGGEIRTVADRRFSPPKRNEHDRQVTFWFEEELTPSTGDEGQSVYWLVEVPEESG